MSCLIDNHPTKLNLLCFYIWKIVRKSFNGRNFRSPTNGGTTNLHLALINQSVWERKIFENGQRLTNGRGTEVSLR